MGMGSSSGIGFTQPVINGELYYISRYPKTIPTPRISDWIPLISPSSGTNCVFSTAIPAWSQASLNNIFAHGYWGNTWADEYIQITDLTSGKKQFTLKNAPSYSLNSSVGKFQFVNVLDEMVAGEYAVAINSQKVYFVPRDPSKLQNSFLTHLSYGFQINAVNDLVFENIGFIGSQGIGFQIVNSDRVQFRNCIIQYCGTRAIDISGGTNNLIYATEIMRTGTDAISIQAGNRTSLMRCDHIVKNCTIHDYSEWVRTYCGAVSMHGSVGVTIDGGEIYNAPHAAIFFSGNNNTIKNVIFHDVCQETGDVGVLYIGRDWTQQGHLIDRCYFYNIVNAYGLGSSCVYLDDLASGNTVTNCIAENIDKFLLLGGGRDNIVKNCLIINAKRPINVDSRGLEGRASDVAGSWDMFGKLKAMPYTTSPWKDQYPSLANILNEIPAAPQHNIIQNLIIYKSGTGSALSISGGASKYLTPTQIYQTTNLSDIPFTDPKFVHDNNYAINPNWTTLATYGFQINTLNLTPYASVTPIPTPTPTGTAMLKLYNSATNKFVQDLTQNTTLPFDANYTVVYQSSVVASTHSVIFFVNGKLVKVEGIAPYSISGDTNGVLNIWPQILKDTPMNITATEYSGQNQTGTVVNTSSVQLTLATATPAPTPVLTPTSHLDYQLQVSGSMDMSQLKVNGNIQFIFNDQ
jgi:hypothetical protein